MRWSQSAADGSLDILQASFGQNVNSGELWEPSGFMQMSGLPKVSSNRSSETDERQGNLLWKASEAAIKEIWFKNNNCSHFQI